MREIAGTARIAAVKGEKHMREITIKEALPDDAGKLIGYMKLIGGESDNLTFGSDGLPVTIEQEREFINNIHEDKRSALILAWKGDQLIGDGSLTVLPRRMNHRAELGIAVRKSEWGNGVGSMIMRELIAHAKNHNIEIISLEVKSDNLRAVRLYEKFGFRRIGTFPAYFKTDGQYSDFELMYLDLR